MKKIIFTIIILLFVSCSNVEKSKKHKGVEVKISFIGANLSTIDEKKEDVRYKDKIYKIQSGGVWRMIDPEKRKDTDVLFYTGKVKSESTYNSLYGGKLFSKILDDFKFDFFVPEENFWINKQKNDNIYISKNILLSNIVPKDLRGMSWNRSYIKTIKKEKIGFISVRKNEILGEDFLNINIEETINEIVEDLKREDINKVILITDLDKNNLRKIIERTRGISFIFKEKIVTKDSSIEEYKNKDRKIIKFYNIPKIYNLYGSLTIKFDEVGDVVGVEDHSKLIYGEKIIGFNSDGIFGKDYSSLFLSKLLKPEYDIEKKSENIKIKEKYKEEISKANHYSEKIVGFNERSLSKRELLKEINNIIYDEYNEKIDIVMQDVGVLKEGLKYGDIKVKDLYEIPREEEAYVAINLSGRELKKVTSNYIGKSNGDMEIIIKNSDSPIERENLLIGEKKYNVLLNIRLYEKLFKNKKKIKTSKDILYFLKKYIEENKKTVDSFY